MMNHHFSRNVLWLVFLTAFSLSGCTPAAPTRPATLSPEPQPALTRTPSPTSRPVIPSSTPTPAPSPTPTATLLPSPTPSPTPPAWDGYLALVARLKKKPKEWIGEYYTFPPFLFLARYGGETLTQITETSTDVLVSWSPNGKKLAFVADDYSMDISDELIQFLDLESMQIQVLQPHWPEGGQGSTNRSISSQAWSADGKSILFNNTYGPRWLIHRMDVESQEANFITEGGFSAAWLDGGRSLIWLIRYWDENYKLGNWADLVRYDLEDNTETFLAQGLDVISYAISPDGTQIAHSVVLGEIAPLYVINTDGSGRKRIAHFATNVSWTPDGRSLLYAWDCDIYQVEIETKQSQKLSLPDGYCYYFAALQPTANETQ
jgi:Tol biopolymer transport system component